MKQPAPDVVVAGKYILEGQLASGGMGSVWVAKHRDLGVPVAIKFMDPECASTEEGRSRFEREAKAAALLQSPNVVSVQDYGVDEGLAYIVMELLVGEDLEDRLFREERLSLEQTLSILAQAAKALRRAQDLGIVHRDIKPQNLFISTANDGEEIVKILDFGIAKETGPVLLAGRSNTGQIIGSPHYMSPEQVRGAKDLDCRADLWSLGVIVFQCVTGHLPFPGENVGDVMGMILADPLPKATQIAPDLPPELDDFFDKALARDRTRRFQSAREMTEAFADIVGPPSSGHPLYPPFSARPPAVAPVSGSTPPPPSVRPPARSAPGVSLDKTPDSPSRTPSLPPASLAAVEASAKSKRSVTDSVSLPAPQPSSRKGPILLTVALLAIGATLLFLGAGAGKGTDPAHPAAEASTSAQGSAGTNDPARPSSTSPLADSSAQPTSQPEVPPATSAQPAASSSAATSAGATATQGTSGKTAGKGTSTAAPRGTSKPKTKPVWGF